MSTTMDDVRKALMDTLSDLRDKDKPMEVDRARAVAQVAGVLVDSARVEVEFLKLSQGHQSKFIAPESVPELPKGVVGIRQHRIAG